MAVTSLLTSLENFESSPSYFNIGSGGGASDDTNAFIEGAQAGGRRVDNATDKGFGATFTAADLSAANQHVRLWAACFHWAVTTQIQIRISDGTNDDDHDAASLELPGPTQFWVPLWCDVSRAPEVGGSANEASIDRIGAFIDIGNIGGAGSNFFIDEIMHGTSGYRWLGASGSFADFRTYEDTNVEGVFIARDGVDFLYSRLEIGTSTSAGFTDSGFNLVCPAQGLVSATFMGMTIDLQNASTAVDLSNGSFASGDPTGSGNKPDLLVSGTSGTFDMDTMLLNGLRTIELTDACTLTKSVIQNTGVVDATIAGSAGADLSGSSILSSTVAADASALVWDVNADPDGELDDMTIAKGANAHHALELGTNSPLTVTVRGWTVTGFNASDTNNDSTFHVLRTSGTVTINVIGGTGNFSFKSAGATVVIVIDPVTTLVIVSDPEGNLFQNAQVVLEVADGTNEPFEASVSITRSGATATVSHTAHAMSNGDKVSIKGVEQPEYKGVKTISNVSANAYDYTVSGSPDTPATGTIEATFAVLAGLTDVNGEISSSKSWSSDQPVKGQARKSTAAPFYKTLELSGTIDTVDGLLINRRFAPD